jgi:hypothetical protein
MSRKYYRMNPAALLVFLTNFNSIAGDKQTELNVSAFQLAELQTIKTLLEEKVNNRRAALDAAAAAKVELKQTVKDVTDLIGSLNNGFKSNRAISDALIELLGLDADENPLTAITPVAPVDLVVEGRSNAINYVKWKSGGNNSRTTYILEAKIGAANEYIFVKALTKQRFEHKNQTPGVRALYRVKAIHGELESAYSNEAVVYN